MSEALIVKIAKKLGFDGFRQLREALAGCLPRIQNFVAPIIESVRRLARIIPYPTGRLLWVALVPGTSCQATIAPSRDESHWPIEGPSIELAPIGFTLGLLFMATRPEAQGAIDHVT